MATIPSTVEEFNKDCAKFIRLQGNKSYSQEAIRGAYKALNLRYLGLTGATDEEVGKCAMFLKIATNGALARGWEL